MAVKEKGKAKPIFTQIREAITKAVDELFNEHSGEISQVLDEAEDKCVAVTFGVKVDCSESEPMVTTGIRFSQSVTDKRVARLDDPRQITLFKTAAEANPEQEELPAAGDADAKPDKKTRKTKIKAEDVPAEAGEAKAE